MVFLVYGCNFFNLSANIEICSFKGSTESHAEISNCCFRNLISSSSGHASSIYLTKLHSKIQKCLFDSCKCSNSVDDNGANAIYQTNYNIMLYMSTITKCCESNPQCDTAVYVYSADESNISNINFTQNCGAKGKSNGYGSSEVEQYLVTKVNVNYVSSVSGSADRAFLMSNGLFQNSNIIKFNGASLLDTIKKAIHCCFFNNKISSYPSIPMENCISDDTKLSATITIFNTLEIEYGNRYCIVDKANINTNKIVKGTVIVQALNLVNLIKAKYFYK